MLMPVAVALGSNLGARSRSLDLAVGRLREGLTDVLVSSYYDTAPVGVGPQSRFLNAAVVGMTDRSARGMLQWLLAIETDLGRERLAPGIPRTVDLDLIFYGEKVAAEPDLAIPHPRFRERAFVLEPLNEIAQEWRDPVSGLTVAELLARLWG
jgi:2-amino-4-hydroxy-6-hydroxymethyldihydropteridine diphosphokinase